MKYCILLVLILLFKFSYAQFEYDSIKKYSYYVLLISKGKAVSDGSGFFVKRGGKLFFVTNYHVATGYDFINEKELFKVDRIAVMVDSGIIMEFVMFKTKRDFEVERKLKCLERADLEIIEVDTLENKITSAVKIFDLSSFVLKKAINKNFEKIFTYGYPENNIKDLRPSGEWAILNSVHNYDSISKLNMPKTLPECIKQGDYLKKYNKLNFFSGRSNVRTGMSGSPVFGLFSTKKGKDIKFVGVIFGGNIDLNIAEIVRGEVVIKYIDLLLK